METAEQSLVKPAKDSFSKLITADGTANIKKLQQYYFKSFRKLRLPLAKVKTESGQEIFDKLCAGYISDSRQYHNFDHVAFFVREVLRAFSKFRMPNHAVIAGFGHDLYNGIAPSIDERKSADFLIYELNKLGMAKAELEYIYGLIMATDHSKLVLDEDQKLFADIDLVPMALENEIFMSNMEKIRKEYKLTPEDFKKNQETFFGMILLRPSIYQSEYFGYLDEQARHNIESYLHS